MLDNEPRTLPMWADTPPVSYNASMQMHVCMWYMFICAADVWDHLSAYEGMGRVFNVLLALSLPLIPPRQSFSSKLQNSPHFCPLNPSSWIIGMCVAMPILCAFQLRGLNWDSDPHICTASILLTNPSPHPLLISNSGIKERVVLKYKYK